MPLFRDSKQQQAQAADRIMLLWADQQKTIGELQNKLDEYSPPTQVHHWLETYERQPIRRFDDIRHGLADMVLKLQWTFNADHTVPEEFKYGPPKGKESLQVQEGYQIILTRNAHEILDAFYAWRAELSYQMDDSEPFVSDFVVNVLGFSLLQLRWLYAEWNRSAAIWGGHTDEITDWEQTCLWWRQQQLRPQQRLEATVADMRIHAPNRLNSTGFLDDMWPFFGIK